MEAKELIQIKCINVAITDLKNTCPMVSCTTERQKIKKEIWAYPKALIF